VWSSGTASTSARSLEIPKRKQSGRFGDDAMGAMQIKEWFNRFDVPEVVNKLECKCH
jgi:hypothetical protein